MTPQIAKDLLNVEQDRYREDEERNLRYRLEDSHAGDEAAEPHRLVIDPCLGRCEVIRAKVGLACAILCGLILLLLTGSCGHWWLSHLLKASDSSPYQASLVLGVILPLMLAMVLCLLEHAESRFLNKVS
eukprot:CAMPEP_0169386570 /NCGR_PEP_ID=MMETSP1017-20121227/44840_1 /TAXON_ID=342587 /ORGANISM="Karlodinium micrum, Strain CCMP2283" /LENGTH=129 /DNA_ID=CAMNT_0009487821 /DNA_START=186 /DNA_END=571 /DNA_ORIENTATION=-